MNKTIGYCTKTTGCTRESGFLFAETRCNNQSFDKNITDNNSFDTNIPDVKKKHAWRLHELCVENVGKRDIRCHDKPEAMYHHKAGSFSVSCKSCKICLWEEQLFLCQAFVVCLTLMC